MFKDSLIYLVSKVVPGLAGLLSVVVFVRLIGVAEYGQYALGFSAVTMLGALAVAWLNQAQLRYYSRHEDDPGQFRHALGAGRRAALLFIALAGLIAVLGYHLWPIPLPRSGLVLIFALCAVFVQYLIRMVTFQAQVRPGEVVRMESLRAILGIVVPLLLCLAWPDHRALLLGLCLAYVACFLLPGPWRGGVSEARSSWRETRKILLSFWRYGWPMSLWSGAMLCLPVIDRSLIQHFHGFEQTGAYSSIYDLVVRVYTLLFFPVTLAAHPRIMAAWNRGNKKEAFSLIRKSLLFQVALFLPFFALNFFAAPLVVRLILGRSFPGIDAIILPLACGGALWQMALLSHKPLEMTGNTRLMLVFIVASLLTSLLINYWGLPRFGMVASAYANLFSALVYLLLCWLFTFHARKKNELESLVNQ
jgi:O-antigen/teichoic acid export membrane protein